MFVEDRCFRRSFWRRLVPFIVMKAKHVVNMDISISTIQLARARYPELQAVKADVRCLPYVVMLSIL